ncbi:hypothetical protein TNCV_3581351 [Trichonephila clavipes]|nr:hypothetical protein TNCV_3581351 [Trichonephila clavipes]
MPCPKRSQVATRNNIPKRWNTTENDASENQPSATTAIRLSNTSVSDKTAYFLDVPSYVIIGNKELTTTLPQLTLSNYNYPDLEGIPVLKPGMHLGATKLLNSFVDLTLLEWKKKMFLTLRYRSIACRLGD